MLSANTLLNGRYRIEKLVGQGGTGAVYKAWAEHLQMMVAVKETTATNESLLMGFEKQAQRLARLSHPALPRVIEHFVQGHGHYLVMEFIEGANLAEKLQATGEAFDVEEALALGDQLLQALEYLHGQQPPVIHRDIKPQNIKVMRNGFLILLDFGLTKGGLMPQYSNGSESSFAYSVGYASPEQMSILGSDQRSDLYSVAATIWTLLSGQSAIDAQVRQQAAKDGIPDPMRPVNELNSQVSPLVAQVLSNALALNRQQRPKSAHEMRQQLRAEVEQKRQAQQQARQARHQAELERLRRKAKAAREEIERESGPAVAVEGTKTIKEPVERERSSWLARPALALFIAFLLLFCLWLGWQALG